MINLKNSNFNDNVIHPILKLLFCYFSNCKGQLRYGNVLYRHTIEDTIAEQWLSCSGIVIRNNLSGNFPKVVSSLSKLILK